MEADTLGKVEGMEGGYRAPAHQWKIGFLAHLLASFDCNFAPLKLASEEVKVRKRGSRLINGYIYIFGSVQTYSASTNTL